MNSEQCNFLNDENNGWVLRNTKGKFPPTAFSHKYFDTSRQLPSGPFQHVDYMIFVHDTIFHIDKDDTNRTQVFAVQLSGFQGVYIPYDTLKTDMPKEDPFGFSFTEVPSLEDLYLQDYTESKRILKSDTINPRHLYSDDSAEFVTWAESGVDTTPGHETVTDIRVFSVSDGAVIKPDIAPPATGCSRGSPSVCGSFLAFAEYDPTASTSRVLLYSRDTKGVELLSRPISMLHNFFDPKMAHSSDSASSTCILAWVGVPGPVSIDSAGFITPSQGEGKDLTIHSLELPVRNRRSFGPADWGTATYTRLWSYQISNGFLAVVVSNDLATSFLVRYYSWPLDQWRDLLPSESSNHLHLLTSAQRTFIYSKSDSQGNSEIFVLHLGGLGNEDWSVMLCRLLSWTPQNPVLGVSLYEDIVVWIQLMPGDSEATFFRVDLNKDNDLLYDGNDRYPLFGEFTLDADNDGIGDEGDILTAKGPCVNGRRNECLSDLSILYSVYGSIFALCIAAVVIHYFVRLKFLKFEAQIAAVQEADFGRSQIFELLSAAHMFGGAAPTAKVQRNMRASIVVCAETSSSVPYEPFSEKDIRRYRIARFISDLIDAFFVVMTLLSVILVMAPFYQRAESLQMRNSLLWMDWYVSGVFLIDVFFKVVLRDRHEFPTVRRYCTLHWYEYLSLVTDIPGITAGIIRPYEQAIPLVLAYRVIRVLKIARLIRLFYRLKTNRLLFPIIHNNPFRFLSLFMVSLIVLGALAIKTHEQYGDTRFETIWNVLWYTLITASTVGYGDLVASTYFGRSVSIFVAFLGIGMLGMLSAKMVQKILAADTMQRGLRQRKLELQEQRKQERINMEKMSAYHNPLNAVLKGTSIAEDALLLQNAMENRAYRHIALREQDLSLPVEQLTEDSGMGKFTNHDISRGAVHDRNSRRRKQVALMKPDEEITHSTLLSLILKSYGLHHGGLTMTDYEFSEFWDELYSIIFCPSGPYQTYVEKVMTISRHQQLLEQEPPIGFYDTIDPLFTNQRRIDELFRKFRLSDRVDFHEIWSQVRLVLLYQERLENARWAIENLEFKMDVKPSPPVVSAMFEGAATLATKSVGLATAKKLGARARRRLRHNNARAHPNLPSVPGTTADEDHSATVSRSASTDNLACAHGGGASAVPSGPSMGPLPLLPEEDSFKSQRTSRPSTSTYRAPQADPPSHPHCVPHHHPLSDQPSTRSPRVHDPPLANGYHPARDVTPHVATLLQADDLAPRAEQLTLSSRAERQLSHILSARQNGDVGAGHEPEMVEPRNGGEGSNTWLLYVSPSKVGRVSFTDSLDSSASPRSMSIKLSATEAPPSLILHTNQHHASGLVT